MNTGAQENSKLERRVKDLSGGCRNLSRKLRGTKNKTKLLRSEGRPSRHVGGNSKADFPKSQSKIGKRSGFQRRVGEDVFVGERTAGGSSRKRHRRQTLFYEELEQSTKDKDATTRLADLDYGQIVADELEENMKSVPMNHMITDVTEKSGEMLQSLRECDTMKYRATLRRQTWQLALEGRVIIRMKQSSRQWRQRVTVFCGSERCFLGSVQTVRSLLTVIGLYLTARFSKRARQSILRR